MKTIQKLSVLLVCLTFGLMSMECDRSPEPDHVKFISYQVSAELNDETYAGPKDLASEITKWIENNEVYYDLKYEYQTGAASEFTKFDTEALTKYEPFKTKFTQYLDGIKGRIAKGDFSIKDGKVSASFRVFCERGQGQDRVLKEETINFSYP